MIPVALAFASGMLTMFLWVRFAVWLVRWVDRRLPGPCPWCGRGPKGEGDA